MIKTKRCNNTFELSIQNESECIGCKVMEGCIEAQYSGYIAAAVL
jgi:hypothetical protein